MQQINAARLAMVQPWIYWTTRWIYRYQSFTVVFWK